jgi:hypothetical protein
VVRRETLNICRTLSTYDKSSADSGVSQEMSLYAGKTARRSISAIEMRCQERSVAPGHDSGVSRDVFKAGHEGWVKLSLLADSADAVQPQELSGVIGVEPR